MRMLLMSLYQEEMPVFADGEGVMEGCKRCARVFLDYEYMFKPFGPAGAKKEKRATPGGIRSWPTRRFQILSADCEAMRDIAGKVAPTLADETFAPSGNRAQRSQCAACGPRSGREAYTKSGPSGISRSMMSATYR